MVHDGGVGQSRVVATKISLGGVQLRPTGSVEEMYEREPFEELAGHAYQSHDSGVVDIFSTIHVPGDHVHVSRFPRCGSGPVGQAKVEQWTEHLEITGR